MQKAPRPPVRVDTFRQTAGDSESEYLLTSFSSPPLFRETGLSAPKAGTQWRKIRPKPQVSCTGSEPVVHVCVMVPNERQPLYGYGVKLSDFMVGLVGQMPVKGIRFRLGSFCNRTAGFVVTGPSIDGYLHLGLRHG